MRRVVIFSVLGFLLLSFGAFAHWLRASASFASASSTLATFCSLANTAVFSAVSASFFADGGVGLSQSPRVSSCLKARVATGRRITWDHVSIVKVKDGRVTGQWAQPDLWGIYRQLTSGQPVE